MDENPCYCKPLYQNTPDAGVHTSIAYEYIFKMICLWSTKMLSEYQSHMTNIYTCIARTPNFESHSESLPKHELYICMFLYTCMRVCL